jgi:hypothetical protein
MPNRSVRFEALTALTLRKQTSRMLSRVDLVRTDVSKGRIAYIVRVIRIGALGTTLQ